MQITEIGNPFGGRGWYRWLDVDHGDIHQN